jgi:hypothetical protein
MQEAASQTGRDGTGEATSAEAPAPTREDARRREILERIGHLAYLAPAMIVLLDPEDASAQQVPPSSL